VTWRHHDPLHWWDVLGLLALVVAFAAVYLALA
jgi:hypothetical protein